MTSLSELAILSVAGKPIFHYGEHRSDEDLFWVIDDEKFPVVTSVLVAGFTFSWGNNHSRLCVSF